MQAVAPSTGLDKDKVNAAVQVILETLGEPISEVQAEGLRAFHAGDASLIKRLSVGNLSDNYLKCLGYLVSAPKLTPNTDTILAESARSAAEHMKDKTLAHLSDAMMNALG